MTEAKCDARCAALQATIERLERDVEKAKLVRDNATLARSHALARAEQAEAERDEAIAAAAALRATAVDRGAAMERAEARVAVLEEALRRCVTWWPSRGEGTVGGHEADAIHAAHAALAGAQEPGVKGGA